MALKRRAAPGVDGVTWQDEGGLTCRAICWSCTDRSNEARTGRCASSEGSSPSKTASCARWASRRWRTKSTSAPPGVQMAQGGRTGPRDVEPE